MLQAALTVIAINKSENIFLQIQLASSLNK